MVGLQPRGTRLKLSDLTALVRLAGEAGELLREPARRRAHILLELSTLCGADKGVYAQFQHAGERWDLMPGSAIFHDTPVSELRKVSTFYTHMHPRDPVMDRMAASEEAILVTTPYTYFDRDAWRQSSHFNEVRRPSQIMEQLYAQYRVNGVTYGIGLHRRREQPFTRRELQIVSIFLTEAGRTLLDAPAARGAAMESLPARLRPVLDRFLHGQSEKEAARDLGLTQHTVHTYAKQIYRHLNVSSRAELLARFIDN